MSEFDQDSNGEDESSQGDPLTGGAGAGGAMGAPSSDLDEAPPGTDQEANEVVSGGGLVGPEDDGPSGNDGEPSDKSGA